MLTFYGRGKIDNHMQDILSPVLQFFKAGKSESAAVEVSLLKLVLLHIYFYVYILFIFDRPDIACITIPRWCCKSLRHTDIPRRWHSCGQSDSKTWMGKCSAFFAITLLPVIIFYTPFRLRQKEAAVLGLSALFSVSNKWPSSMDAMFKELFKVLIPLIRAVEKDTQGQFLPSNSKHNPHPLPCDQR